MTTTNKMVANRIEIFKVGALEVFSDKIDDKTIYRDEATLSYDDAVKKGFSISLSKSQLLEWIYANRGIDLNEVAKEAAKLRVLIRNTNGVARENYKQQLHELHFVDEIVQVEIKSKKAFAKLSKGFTLNGQRYVYLVSKGKEVLTFIREDLYEEFAEKLNGGRNVEIQLNASKLSAYKSLAMTDSKRISSPNRVIVVDEYEVEFNADYMWVGDTGIETRINQQVSRTVNDGASFISPELGMKWSKELQKDKMVSAYQVRQMWTKGIQYVVDFQRYFAENNITHITDVWGHEQSVEDVDCILNASQVKLWSAYDSCEDWLANADKYGYGWRVAKYSKPSSQHKSNYQQLITYEDLTDEDIKELIAPSIAHINNVQTSWEHQVLYLNGRDMSEDYEFDTENVNIAQALMIEPRLAKDKFVRTKIIANLGRTKKDMGTGNLLLEKESYFRIILPDPVQLLEGMVGIKNSKGCLKPYEVYCKAFKTNSEAIAFRSPMLVHENIAKVKVVDVDSQYSYLFEHLDENVVVLDGNSLIVEQLCGCDFDGDTIQITTNNILLSKYKKSLPIACSNLGGGTKEVITDEVPLLKAASLMCSSSIPSIGSVINDGTAMFSVLSTLEKDSAEYIEVKSRLLHMVRISQSVIDTSKNGKYYPTPREWTKGNDTLATQKRKPLFQLDKYDAKKADFNEINERINYLSIASFGITFDELLKVEQDKLSASQLELIQLYNENCNVFVDDNNTMNRIHSAIHSELKEIRSKAKYDKTTKDLLKSSLTYNMQLDKDLREILLAYSNDIKTFNCKVNNTISDIEERAKVIGEYKNRRREAVINQIKLLDEDVERVTNAFVDIVYKSGRFSEIMWSACGEQIIENLLNNGDGTMKVIVKDTNGSINYLGTTYSVIEKKLK